MDPDLFTRELLVAMGSPIITDFVDNWSLITYKIVEEANVDGDWDENGIIEHKLYLGSKKEYAIAVPGVRTAGNLITYRKYFKGIISRTDANSPFSKSPLFNTPFIGGTQAGSKTVDVNLRLKPSFTR